MLSDVRVKCKTCKKVTARGVDEEEYAKHYDGDCPIPCTQKCGARVSRNNLRSHLANECVLRMILCPGASVGCTTSLTPADMAIHARSCVAVSIAPFVQPMRDKVAHLEALLDNMQACHKCLSVFDGRLGSCPKCPVKNVYKDKKKAGLKSKGRIETSSSDEDD
jgi:hypothetical protein